MPLVRRDRVPEFPRETAAHPYQSRVASSVRSRFRGGCADGGSYPGLCSQRGRREIQLEFSSGDVCADGWLLPLREVDRQLRPTERIAVALSDERDASRIRHSRHDLVRQRVDAIAQGCEL